ADSGKPQALVERRNDRPPNCLVDGMIIKYDFAIPKCHAKFLPDLVKIDGSWFIPHVFVEALQDIGANCAVSDSKGPFDVPFFGDNTAVIQNCPQGIL